MHKIETLDVYQRAYALILEIYKNTKSFPKEEIYGLSSQMQRSAISIGSNLMEGWHRGTDGEYKHFVGIAIGSAAELKCQMMIAKDLNYISSEKSELLIKEIGEIISMLIGLHNSIK